MDEPSQPNPYASPLAADEAVGNEIEPYRDGDLIVSPVVATLPTRCTVCNERAENRRTLFLSGWISPSGVFNINIKWFVCDEHDRRLRERTLWRLLAIVGGTLAAVAVGVSVGIFFGVSAISVGAAAGVIGGLQPFLKKLDRWSGKPLEVTKVTRDGARLKGAGEPFLQSLEEGD